MPPTKVAHIWMPDGRSLCDRAARPARTPLSDKTPACGACINIVGDLRQQAVVLRDFAHGKVHPGSVGDGWRQMFGTRWDTFYDLEVFVDGRDFDSDMYDAVGLSIDPAKVKAALVRRRARMDAEKPAPEPPKS